MRKREKRVLRERKRGGEHTQKNTPKNFRMTERTPMTLEKSCTWNNPHQNQRNAVRE